MLIIVTFSLALSSTSYAANIQEEALGSLSTAQEFIKEGKYNKAVKEISYSLAKINEITAAKLLLFIPDPPEGFTLVSKNSQSVVSGNSISITCNSGATASYIYSSGVTIDLNFAIGSTACKIASPAALGSTLSAMTGKSRTVRVQGYTGTEIFSGDSLSGILTFQLGNETALTIVGNGINFSINMLMQFANKINLAGIAKAF